VVAPVVIILYNLLPVVASCSIILYTLLSTWLCVNNSVSRGLRRRSAAA
jgi:hypothetical protein